MGQLSELPLDPATNGGYTPVPYRLTEPVSALSSVPRLTSSHCTEDLLNSDLRTEYLIGLLSGSIFIVCVYILWTLVVLVLKCLGPKRVGCASGTPVKPSKPVNSRNATGSRLRDFNPYEEGADEEFLAEVAADGKIGGKNIGEYGGIGDDGDGIYEAAHRARYGDPGGTFTSADFRGMSAAANGGDDFAFTDTVASELAFGDDADPPKGGKGGRVVAPFGSGARGGEGEEYDYDEALAQWEKKKKRFDRRMAVTRVFFLLSGCAVIASSILFYYEGVWGLGRTIRSVQDGIKHAQKVLLQAHNLTANFVEAQSALDEQRSAFEMTEDICPSLFQEWSGDDVALYPGADTNGTNGTAALPPNDDVEEIINEAADAIQNASRWMEGIGDQLVATAVDLQNGLNDASLQAEKMNENLDNLYPYLWTSVYIAATIDLMIVIFMISVLAAWCGCKCNSWCIMRSIRNALCMPMFLIMVFLSWFCAAVFLLGAVAGADFCVAPDVHVSRILGRMRENAISAAETDSAAMGRDVEFEVTLVYNLALYYVRQCRADYYPSEVYDTIANFAGSVGGAANSFDQFLDSVADAPPGGDLSAICGEDGSRVVMSAASVLHSQLHVVWDVLAGALGLLGCANFNPIYNTISHDAICVNGQSALAWILASSLSIAVFSMMMVSLRAGWYTASVDKSEEHIFKSAKDEEARRRKERREQCCGRVLWVLLLVLMVAALFVSIYYGLNGFQGETSGGQCPAEQRQFASLNSNIESEQITSSPTFSPIPNTAAPATAMRPTMAPSILTNDSSEEPSGEPTIFAPSSSILAPPTDASMESILDTPTETVTPECNGRRNVPHKIVFTGLEDVQGDALDTVAGIEFSIKMAGEGLGEVETVFTSAHSDFAGGQEHFVCLTRQTCYYALLGRGSAAFVENALSWEIQQMDSAASDGANVSPITIASGSLQGGGESCTFTVPFKNSSKRPVCPTTCATSKEEVKPKCKRLSTLHELSLLPNGVSESYPKEVADAAVKISVSLPNGNSRDIRTITVKDLISQEGAKNYFCLRRDRCYIANAVFPAGSMISNEGSSVRWQMRKVQTGKSSGEVGMPVASGEIVPSIAQGPGDVLSEQCTFSLKKGSNAETGSNSVCPTTCVPPSDNIFNASMQKSSAQAKCKGRKQVLHEVILTRPAGKPLIIDATLTIEQDSAQTAEKEVAYTVPFGSTDEKHFVCLKRQQCYTASLKGASAADESEAGWMIQEVSKGNEQASVTIASGGFDATKSCTFTVVLKNTSNDPVCPTTCSLGEMAQHGTQLHLTKRNSFDRHQRQPHTGLAPTHVDDKETDYQTEHQLDRHWSPH